MRKITTTFALVLALSFFCSFDSHATLNGYKSAYLTGTLSGDGTSLTFNAPELVIDNIYMSDAGRGELGDEFLYNGADSFYLHHTVTFEYAFVVTDITNESLDNLYQFYLSKLPVISIKNLDCDSSVSSVFIQNVSFYYVANGQRLEVGESTWEYIFHDKLRSRANFFVEVDLLIEFAGVIDYDIDSACGIEFINFDVVCSSFNAVIKRSTQLSEFGLLKSINNNITTLLSNLKTYFGNLTSNLSTWFDRQHDDFIDLRTNIVSTLNTNFSTLTSKLTTWFNRNHQDLLDLGEKLANEYDDTDAEGTASDFEDITSDLDDIQGGVVSDATDGLGEYTLDSENGIKALYGVTIGATLVSSMLQSIFSSTPAIGVVISVTFSMVLACMLVGLFRYFKR